MVKSLRRFRSLWHASRFAAMLRDNEILRFIVAGGVNTLLGYALYSLAIIFGAAAWLALLVSMLMGSIFNFFTTGGYAFRQLSKARYPRFVTCYLVVYSVNLMLLEALSLSISNKLVSQAILLVPLAVLSYVLMARLVFVKRN